MDNEIHVIQPDPPKTIVTVLIREVGSACVSGCEIEVPARELLVLESDKFCERYLESAFNIARNACYNRENPYV